MSIASTLCVGQVLTAEELLKIELHNRKNIYNRPSLFVNAKTVDGEKLIHISIYDLVRRHRLSDPSVIDFLKLLFKIIATYMDLELPHVTTVYAGDISSIEHLLNIDVLLDHEWNEDDGTIFQATLKPQLNGQAYSYSDDKTTLTSKYGVGSYKTHPEILNTLKRIKDNSGRAFVD